MRHALRSLLRQPALSLTVVGTLTVALAFVMTSASILNGLLRHPYPYPKLQQLLLVRDAKPVDGVRQRRPIAIADFLDARNDVGAFTHLTAWRARPIVITSAQAEPERIQGVAVLANFFTTLGVTPVVGQPFAVDADAPGRDGVVVLSRRLWNSRFGADPNLIGREIHLNGRPATVIGIIRDEDCYPSGVDAWVPLVFAPSDRVERAAQRVAAIGRVTDTATAQEASAQLAALSQRLAAQFPLTNRERGFELLPLAREQYEFTAPLFLFVQAAALLVLALAALNVSNLLVARTLDRRHELWVRAMLGGNARCVAGVAVVEVVVLAGASIACGTLAADSMLNLVRSSLPEGIARWIAGWSRLRIDAPTLTMGLGVGLLTTIAIAAIVALTSLRVARETSVWTRTTRRSTWGRRVLVAGEVSLAAALLLGASVMIAGFARIASAFETLGPSRLLRFTLTLSESRYPDDIRVSAFHGALLRELEALPEVETVALIRNEPASNVPNPIVGFDREDRPALQPGVMLKGDLQVVSPAVFQTLRLDVVGGRGLANSDDASGARVAVISHTAAQRFWPDRDPVGTIIRLDPERRPVRIVGVVSDFRLNWYDSTMRPVIYLSDAQSPARTTTVIMRTRTDPLSLVRAVRTAVARLDDGQPLAELEPLAMTVADSLSPLRVIGRLLIIGSALSAALAAIGIYGVLRHWLGSRQREIGVRLALGATGASIARLVILEALLAAGAGTIVGLAFAIGGIRVAGGFLLGVPMLDVGAQLAVAAATLALALAASMPPARRAARVDVTELLRRE